MDTKHSFETRVEEMFIVITEEFSKINIRLIEIDRKIEALTDEVRENHRMYLDTRTSVRNAGKVLAGA